MTKPQLIPLLRPRLPNAKALQPYLERIDDNAFYTNFGPLNQQLQERFTQLQQQTFGRKVFAVTTANATLAIELLLSDLKLPAGSRILLPALTFIGTATAIIRCGHTPVVSEVEEHSWLMTPESLADALDLESIDAVMPVAAFGMPQNVQAWQQWHERTGIPVIVDAAAAFGAQSTSKSIPAVISLHATKCLSTGEGGLVLTEDPEQAHRIAQMSNFGIGSVATVGASNAKMSEYHAAVGHAGLDVWPEMSARRRAMHAQYQRLLSEACPNRIRFQQDTGLKAPSMMVIQFQDLASRVEAERVCDLQSIQTRRWYQPLIHEHSAITGVLAPVEMPHATALAQQLLGIPFHLDMGPKEMERVAAALRQATARRPLKSS